jgi:transcriptional regulator with XRE-family HTH domain
MNAAEARRRRGGSTLVERTKAADPARAARIEKFVAAAAVEQIVQTIMDREHVNATELARRVNVSPPQISRDLHGGLRRATLSRLSMIADALDCDFVPAFVPRSDDSKRKRFLKMYRDLIPQAPSKAGRLKQSVKRTNKKSAPRRASAA